MSALLTGHDGFIGSALWRHFRQHGHTLNTLTSADGRKLRLGQEDSLSRLLEEVPPAQMIIHSAACLRRGVLDEEAHRTNYLGLQQLLQAAAQWRTERLIFLSSVSVYATPQESPITEESALGPGDVYGVSKLFGETSFMAMAGEGVFPICFRICSPVGPGIPSNRLVSKWITKVKAGGSPDVLGQGTKVQHYVDVRDIAAAILLATQHSRVCGIFNLAGPDALSNLDLAKLCLAQLRPEGQVDRLGGVDRDDGDQREYETQKIYRELGFRPQFSMRDSIEAMADSL